MSQKKFLSEYFTSINEFFEDTFLGNSLNLGYKGKTPLASGCTAKFEPQVELELPTSSSGVTDQGDKSGIVDLSIAGSVAGLCAFTQKFNMKSDGVVNAQLEVEDLMENLTVSTCANVNMLGASNGDASDAGVVAGDTTTGFEVEYGKDDVWVKGECERSPSGDFNTTIQFSLQRGTVLAGLQVSNSTADPADNELSMGFGFLQNGWKLSTQATRDVGRWKGVEVGVEHTAPGSEVTAAAQFQVDLTTTRMEPTMKLGASMPFRKKASASMPFRKLRQETASSSWVTDLVPVPEKWALFGSNDGSLATTFFFDNLQPGVSAQCTSRWNSSQFYTKSYTPTFGFTIEIDGSPGAEKKPE